MSINTTLADALRNGYAPRHFTFKGLSESSEFICKEYEISVDGEAVPAADWILCRELYQRFVDEPSPFDRVGLGISIVHEGADGTYILLLEWIEGYMSRQRIHIRNASTDGAFVSAPSELSPCVWERAIYDHENSAYQRLLASGRPPLEDAIETWKASTYSGTW